MHPTVDVGPDHTGGLRRSERRYSGGMYASYHDGRHADGNESADKPASNIVEASRAEVAEVHHGRTLARAEYLAA